MSWHYLTSFLDAVNNHATFIGKVWLYVLTVFRIVLTAVGGESTFYDDQSKFICKSKEIGCDLQCFDEIIHVSPIRFWAWQVLAISTPTILYLLFAMHKTAHAEKDEGQPRSRKRPLTARRGPVMRRVPNRSYEEAEDNGEEDPMTMEEILPQKEAPEKPQSEKHDGRRRMKRDGLMAAYAAQLLVRAALEAAFLYFQYKMYGLEVKTMYSCSAPVCKDTTRCYLPRAGEKTYLLYIMYAVSGLGFFITVLDIVYLFFAGLHDCCRTSTPGHVAPGSQRLAVRRSAQPCYHIVVEIDPWGTCQTRTTVREADPESSL